MVYVPQACQAKVEQHERVVGFDPDIFRLDVAVQDTVPWEGHVVKIGLRGRQLRPVPQAPRRGPLELLPSAGPHRHPVLGRGQNAAQDGGQKRQNDELAGRVVRASCEARDDVWVSHAGEEPDLVLEAPCSVLVGGMLLFHCLHDHRTLVQLGPPDARKLSLVKVGQLAERVKRHLPHGLQHGRVQRVLGRQPPRRSRVVAVELGAAPASGTV
mmetsp:Transcript_38022/g.65214  ORF Transcript_38022/g.65214 Transcript_38022/m.65214 type:complete len:213 (+) Transcript_38022:981-1619(+)